MRSKVATLAAVAVCVFAAPTPAVAADISRSTGSSVDAGLVSIADVCVETYAYVLAADGSSVLIDPAVGDSQIYMFVQRRDTCANHDLSYIYRAGTLEPGALTISPDRTTAALTTGFDTHDWAANRTVHVEVALTWTNSGIRSYRTDQKRHVRTGSVHLVERLDYDTWTASIAGSILVDGVEAISSNVASLSEGHIGADRTSRAVTEQLARIAAAATSTGLNQPTVTSSDVTSGYAHWTGGDGACAASLAEIQVGETNQSAVLEDAFAQVNLTVGRFNVCTGEYFEWISEGWLLNVDDVHVERGGAAISIMKSLTAVSSVTLQPVTINLTIRWDAEASWDSFSSHELSPLTRIHYTSTTRGANPTAVILLDGSRFELGSLDSSYILTTRMWIKNAEGR